MALGTLVKGQVKGWLEHELKVIRCEARMRASFERYLKSGDRVELDHIEAAWEAKEREQMRWAKYLANDPPRYPDYYDYGID